MPTYMPRPEDRREERAETALSLRWLAHEINSLLDGSMRSIRLAESALRRSQDGDPAEVLSRLRAAQEAMHDMATVLERAMADRIGGAEMLRSDRTLGEQVERVRELLQPLADQGDVTLDVTVDATAAGLSAGLLAPVLANGVRNAIEACCTRPARGSRVECAVTLEGGDRLVILITDNGPGLDSAGSVPAVASSGGHGIGLEVCREIVDAMGGSLELMNVPFGAGAVLRIIVPRPGGEPV